MRGKIVIASIVLVLIAGAIGGYWWWTHRDDGGATISVKSLLSLPKSVSLTPAQQEKFAAIKTSLEKNAQDTEALLGLALLKQDVVDLAGAVEAYQKILEVKPDDLLAIINMATVYSDMKLYDKAEEAYSKALAVTPKMINVYNDLLSLYQFNLPKDRAESFVTVLDRGFAANPESESTFMRFYIRYYDTILNKPGQAVQYYKRLIELEPENVEAKARMNEILGFGE